MDRVASRVCLLSASLLGCAGADATPRDRVVEVLPPLPGPRAAGSEHAELEHFSGRIALRGGHIEGRAIGPTPLVPTRRHEPDPTGPQRVELRFESHGLEGVEARLGLLPPRAAARQEVRYDIEGQPSDPRSSWTQIELGPDGTQVFELPAPGPNWHADWALVVVELERGGSVVPGLAGARSEMLSDRRRAPGGRVTLALVPVARRPTRVGAVQLERGQLSIDGRLDEAAWSRPAQTLLHSRTGEPGGTTDERLGGPTEVWFAWDSEFLYVAGSLPDPDLYAKYEQRDDPLYRDEAFEVFLAADNSGRRYLEHQISARNVIFDARFERYRKGEESYDRPWRHAVALDGELEQRGGDRGWTVELGFEWAQLCADTDISCPPAPGQELRINVFRLDKPDRKRQVALALSPTLDPDFHAWTNAAQLVLLGPEDSP